MGKLPKGSKQWWNLAKQIMHKKASSALFPPLKDPSGIWCKDAKTKANLFAQCWSQKNKLPPEVFEMPFFPTRPLMTNLNVIRTRSTCRELAKLRLNQATD